MINVTFTGNIFNSLGNPVNNVRYQGYFIKVNPNSSDTIWDTTRISETNQYNFNLGDNTWLSQQAGYAQPFDKVILCFWTPDTSIRTDTDLVEWAFIEWILDDRDVYVQNVQLKGASVPTCSFAVSGSNVNDPIYLIDTGTTDNNSWIFEGKEHYQRHYWDGYEIFPINSIPDGDILVTWSSAGAPEYYSISDFPVSHIYSTADSYTIHIDVANESLLMCYQDINIDAYYNVYNGLYWGTPVDINTPNTYTPEISGSLAQITGIDYYIDGSLEYENYTYNQSFNHVFTTPGNHTIRQCIKYNDGFDNQIQCQDFIVKLDTKANFMSSDYDCGLVFTDTSVIGNPPVVKYQWDVTDGLFVLAHVEGTAYSDWYYSWPYKGTFHVRLAVTDSNGTTSSITKEYIVSECINGSSDGSGGGDSGGSPWIYSETKYKAVNEPLPVVHIINIDDCDNDSDKNKKILILEIEDKDMIL